MAVRVLPPQFADLSSAAVAAIRRAYDINAERHDPMAGDDAVVFGIGVYRNSWFLLEQAIEDLDAWKSARPGGSLVITGGGLRVHVYRHGHDADADLEAFRLDSARASETQRLIAEANTLQLAFAFEPEPESASPPPTELAELVVIHAGNPDDGCCGIWVGAPIATEEVTYSPWAWIEPLWLREQSGGTTGAEGEALAPVRHDELPEPEIRLEAIRETRSEEK
jgi:hypothetical protein